MSLEPNQAEQRALAETLERQRARADARERRMAALGAGVLIGGETALALTQPLSPVRPLAIALCVACLALASRVRIFLPMGFTSPTQLALVPLLFAAPPVLVAPLLGLALLVAASTDVLRGRMAASRLMFIPVNVVYALGPAAVLAVAHVPAAHGALAASPTRAARRVRP